MEFSEQIRQALARGYTYPVNEKKELDSELIEAMTKEVCILRVGVESQPLECVVVPPKYKPLEFCIYNGNKCIAIFFAKSDRDWCFETLRNMYDDADLQLVVR